MSTNGDKGSDRIASLFFGKSKKNKIVSLDDEKKEKRKSRITYVQTVEDAKSLENQTTPLHPAIKEDVEKEKEKDKGITPPKAKENNPTVSKTKISNDASSSEHVDEETVKETEEVTILPPPPIKIETPIVDEVKQDDKLLELAIIKELTRVIKEDLAELEKLEYEMMVIHDKEEKEYDTKEIEKLREELLDLIRKFEKIKEKYDTKDHDNINLRDFINDNDLYRIVREYTENVKDNVLYDDIQKIEEYISVIDKIAMGEKESESLQNELDDKLDKFNIRDDEFDLMVNSFDNIDDINKRIDAFTKSQDAIIYDLEEKIKSNGDITTNIETYTEFITHTENLIAAALLFNASKKVPPTPAGMIVKSGMIIQAVDLAANFIERRDKTRQTTRVRYDDFSKDINNAIYEVDTASLKIDDAFGKISDLRNDFMNQCSEYQGDIKEFDNFIKMLDDAEAQLKVNKKMLTDYSYSFKQTLDKNNAKVKRLEEIRNND